MPEAEDAIPAMARLVRWAEAEGVTHLATADDHELTDPEIADDADFRRRRSRRTACAARPARRRSPRPRSATRSRSRSPRTRRASSRSVRDRRELLLLKKSFSAFSNPNLEPLLELLKPDEVILFGVATDVCDHAAIMGLLARQYSVAFVEDASAGSSPTSSRTRSSCGGAGGVRFTTTDEVVGS